MAGSSASIFRAFASAGRDARLYGSPEARRYGGGARIEAERILLLPSRRVWQSLVMGVTPQQFEQMKNRVGGKRRRPKTRRLRIQSKK